jgi:hypothetical protein
MRHAEDPSAAAHPASYLIVNGRTHSGVDRALSMPTAKNEVDVIGFAGGLATADAALRADGGVV